jgi:hypothetical protein
MGDAKRATKKQTTAEKGSMKKLTPEFKRTRARTGAMGGKARARSLTKKQRREIAIKASRAAAKKRTEKANL